MAGLDALVDSLTEVFSRFGNAFSYAIDTVQNAYTVSNGYGMDNINKMSAVLTPEGNMTTQSQGESLEGLEYILRNVPPEKRKDVEEKFRLGTWIDSIYIDFIRSSEGQEFIKYLKRNGNGTPRTGVIDDIHVINGGDGLVAATMPDYFRKNLIINQDSIISYARTLSDYTGLSIVDSIKGILAHEIRHIYGQTRAERRGPEHKVEYNNDVGNVEFYTGLAKKDVANSDFYLAKAKLFTVRYDGEYRKNMDHMIDNTREHISKSYGNNSKNYRQAA